MEDKNWNLYIIKDKNEALYTGITKDVKRRFAEHQSQGKKCAKCLRGRDPLELIFFKNVGNLSEALILENKIKKLSKAEKEKFILTNKY